MPNKSVKYKDFKAQLLKDSKVRREYEALEPEFRLMRDVLLRRLELNLNQSQLAKLVGTKQPAISRLEKGEKGDGNITVGTLRRIADALDADLDISLKTRPKTKFTPAQSGPRR